MANNESILNVSSTIGPDWRMLTGNFTVGQGGGDAQMLRHMFQLQRVAKLSTIVVPVTIVILFLVGLVGNILVVYVTVITKRAKKHPIHSLFVLNLAASDIIYLISCAPYQITVNSITGWPFGKLLCPIIPFMAIATTAVSVYTICALAWMRFMALIIPFRFRRSKISTRKAGYFVIGTVWLSAIVLSLPNALYFKISKDYKELDHCDWSGEKAARVYSIILIVSTYAIPLVLVSVFYFMIGREVFCYMVRQASSNTSQNSREEQKDCAKSTIVVLCLILAFLLCGLPNQILTVMKLTKVDTTKNVLSLYILKIISHCMTYAHASVNPLIYTFASPGFRNSLRESLRGRARKCSGSRCSTCDGKGACGRMINRGLYRGYFSDDDIRSPRNNIRRKSSGTTYATHAIRTENIPIFSTTARSFNGLHDISIRSGQSSKASSPPSKPGTPWNSIKHHLVVRTDNVGQVANCTIICSPVKRQDNLDSANNNQVNDDFSPTEIKALIVPPPIDETT